MKVTVDKKSTYLLPHGLSEINKLKKMPDAIYTIEINCEKKRTNPQNNAIHIFCEWVAFELNNAGLTRKLTLKDLGKIDVLWNKDSVKEGIWKPIQKAVLDKENTSDLNVAEVSQVYEHFNLWLSEKGISVPFPAEE